MPKIKSSSSLFSHKSKFRFSGRCESELIASQNDKSIISISPLSINSSKLNENSIYSLNNQIGDKSSTLQYASTFKRRTFINTYRATTLNRNVVANGLATLPKETNPSKSDANNNNLLLLKKVESTNILNNSQASSNATAIRKNTISNQSETGSNKTVIVNQNDTTNCTTDTTNMVSPNPNDFNQYPNLTSTPQTNNKQNSSSSPLVANNLDKSTNSLDNLLDDSNKKQFTLSSDTSTNTPNKTNTETEEEEFYDHDESITPIVNTIRPPSPPPPSLDLVKQQIRINNSIEKQINFNPKTLILYLCVGFLILWFLNRCKAVLFPSSSSSWIESSNSTILDPIISWFFSKYEPN